MSLAIILTTFLRNDLAKSTIDNILKYKPLDSHLLIGDQNKDENRLEPHYNINDAVIYNLPYDCGLSYARNYLVERAKAMECEYCLITADSIHFQRPQDFSHVFKFMETNNVSIVGLGIKDRIPWEFNLDLTTNGFYLTVSKEYANFGGYEYKRVDICRNFFIAKTEILSNILWDNSLKLAEHEDFFWRAKQLCYKVYSIDAVYGTYIEHKPLQYKLMRERLYDVYIPLLLKKYKITNWVNYSPEAIQTFERFRK